MAYDKIIVRHSSDDFYALLTATGMESAGASVFAITPSVGRLCVWAKFKAPITTTLIDEHIEKAQAQ